MRTSPDYRIAGLLTALLATPLLVPESAGAAPAAAQPVKPAPTVATPLPETHTGNPTTKSLDFDKVFSTRGEPATLHYRATYQAKGTDHTVEVWRQGDTRIRRSADGVVETYLTKPGKDPEWHMVVLDQKRQLRSDVDRTALFKVGRFMDWFSFAHAIGHPTAGYTLVAASAPANLPKTLAPCQWYVLTREGHDASVCWSAQYRIPLLISGAPGKVSWRVAGIDTGRLPAATFEIHDAGYIRNNASQDIEND